MSRYQEIAEDLRRRIQEGEWPIGTRLPGITALQRHYEVPGLNTVRAAQKVLVEAGMLSTRQGVGVFVTAAHPVTTVDVVDTLKTAGAAIATAIAALEAPKQTVTLDLSDSDVYFAVTDALGEWAAHQRDQADRELADDPEDTTGQNRLRWAAAAEATLEQIEAAL